MKREDRKGKWGKSVEKESASAKGRWEYFVRCFNLYDEHKSGIKSQIKELT